MVRPVLRRLPLLPSPPLVLHLHPHLMQAAATMERLPLPAQPHSLRIRLSPWIPQINNFRAPQLTGTHRPPSIPLLPPLLITLTLWQLEIPIAHPFLLSPVLQPHLRRLVRLVAGLGDIETPYTATSVLYHCPLISLQRPVYQVVLEVWLLMQPYLLLMLRQLVSPVAR